MIVISVLLLTAGLLLLIKGANWLVDGASALALRFKISPIVIGLTIVAFGTSSPELLVSVTSALSGNTDIAIGNVIGSNIVNILLILGVSALIYPLRVNKNTTWKEVPMSFLGALVVLVLGIQTLLDQHRFSLSAVNSSEVIGSLTFSNGLILLFFFIIFLYYTFGIAKASGDEVPEIKKMNLQKSVLLIVVGLVALGIGSNVFVTNAVTLAKGLGVSELLIGLTIVAVGTSMPELVTNIVAARKKRVELVIGNIVGSNIFNIFFILGVTALIKTIPLTGENLTDILVLFGTTLLLFLSLFVFRKRIITRMEGAFMVLCYVLYLSFLVIRG
jgi:cation:H+ antiporter